MGRGRCICVRKLALTSSCTKCLFLPSDVGMVSTQKLMSDTRPEIAERRNFPPPELLWVVVDVFSGNQDYGMLVEYLSEYEIAQSPESLR